MADSEALIRTRTCLRVHRPEEELTQDGDVLAVILKRSLEADKPGRSNNRLRNIGLAGLECLRGIITEIDPYYVQSGPILAATRSKPPEPFFLVNPTQSMSIHGPTVDMHFTGSREHLSSLPSHLGNIARKLRQIDAKHPLPPIMTAFSHRDMIMVAERLTREVSGATRYILSNPDVALKDSVHEYLDTARAVHGRPPCEDRQVHALTMPTRAFISTFAHDI